MLEKLSELLPEEIEKGMGEFFWGIQTLAFYGLLGIQKKETKVKGEKAYYFDTGANHLPVFLIIHGFTDFKESYLPLAKLLSEKFRVIVPDLPGFGETPYSGGRYTLDGCIDWLEEFSDKLYLGKISGFGNSMGGAILGSHSHHYPDRYNSLIFCCSAGLKIPEKKSFYDEYIKGENLFYIENFKDYEGFEKRVFHGVPPFSYVIKRYLYLQYRNKRFHYSRLMSELMEDYFEEEQSDSFKDALLKNPKPSLVIWGKEDTLFPSELGKEMQRLIPYSEYREIPECGHLPHMEKPLELHRIIEEYYFSNIK